MKEAERKRKKERERGRWWWRWWGAPTLATNPSVIEGKFRRK
jgi:hypothetical protein